MKLTVLRGLAVSGVAVIAAAGFSPAVSAQAAAPAAASTTYQVNLTGLNNSGASGSGTVTVNGNSVTVNIRATGLSASLPHAMHMHVGGRNVCATPSDDRNGNKLVGSREAEAASGPVRVSLTTSGDTSANSALAVDRFASANAQGVLTYNRTFNLPSGVTAASLAQATIDIHGVASQFGDKTKYDGAERSDLDNALPAETTLPAACGKLSTAPTGGAATGVGSINGIESPALFIGGIAAIAGAMAAAVIARKQMANRE